MTWYLVSFREGGASVPLIPNTTITALFDGLGMVSGTSGCNQYTASYTGGKGSLTIGPPVSTRMHCGSPERVMNQEASYLTSLQETRNYSIEGTLNLLNDRGEVILTYTLIPSGTPVPAPLVGTTWYVHSLVDAQGQTRSPRGLTTIMLIFGTDGNVYGNAGCNDHFGPYQKTGENSIVIRDQRTTKIYCGIGGVMELEKAYLETLPEVSRSSVSGDTLLLSDARGEVRIELSTRTP